MLHGLTIGTESELNCLASIRFSSKITAPIHEFSYAAASCTDCIIDYCSYSMGNDMSVLLLKQYVEHVKTLICVSDVLRDVGRGHWGRKIHVCIGWHPEF